MTMSTTLRFRAIYRNFSTTQNGKNASVKTIDHFSKTHNTRSARLSIIFRFSIKCHFSLQLTRLTHNSLVHWNEFRNRINSSLFLVAMALSQFRVISLLHLYDALNFRNSLTIVVMSYTRSSIDVVDMELCVYLMAYCEMPKCAAVISVNTKTNKTFKWMRSMQSNDDLESIRNVRSCEPNHILKVKIKRRVFSFQKIYSKIS